MSTSAGTSSTTIHVIVFLRDENEPIEFNFLFEKFNWDNLALLIRSSSTLEPPVVLYYKLAFDGAVKALESQEHLTQLLTTLESPATTTLRFYGNQEQVTSPVFVSAIAAFNRLGALVDQNKQVVQCSHRIAKWIGILASMMATSDKTFDQEFQVLERLIQRKTFKLKHRRNPGTELVETDGVISACEDEEFVEAPEVVDLDSRLDDLDIGGRGGRGGHGGRGGRGGRGGKCGHDFGGRGYGFCGHGFGGHGFGGHGRPRPRSYEFFEGFLDCAGSERGDAFSGLNDSDEEARRRFAKFAGGRHHYGKHHPYGGRTDSQEETFGSRGFGKSGGRHYRHHGKHSLVAGPSAGRRGRHFGGLSDSDEEFCGRYHGKHFGGRRGHDGCGSANRSPPPGLNSNEELFGGHGFGVGHKFGGGRGLGGHGFGCHGRSHWE